jgi:hypothetical protein
MPWVVGVAGGEPCAADKASDGARFLRKSQSSVIEVFAYTHTSRGTVLVPLILAQCQLFDISAREEEARYFLHG